MAQIILDSSNNLIQGDFDNVTLNNRTKLQTTTTDATTNVYIVPNGTATSAGVSVANNSDLTNASKIVMATNGATDTQIISGINGTGSYLPMSFYTNNTLAGQFDTSGNLTVTGSVTATGGFVQGATAAPAFSAYSTTLTSVSNTTFTKVTFNTEEFDTNSNFASSRFTPTVAGYYQINTCISGPGSGTGIMLANIFKNGSNFKSGNQIPNNAAGTYVVVAALIYFNGSTDYVEIYAYQNTGGPVNLGSNSVDFAFSGSLARSA